MYIVLNEAFLSQKELFQLAENADTLRDITVPRLTGLLLCKYS